MEGWGVEVEIFVVALILFAEYIVSCSDDEVGVDEEGSAIEGDSSGCIGVFEQTYGGVGMCEYVRVVLWIVADLLMQQIGFGCLFYFVIVEPYFVHGLSLGYMFGLGLHVCICREIKR